MPRRSAKATKAAKPVKKTAPKKPRFPVPATNGGRTVALEALAWRRANKPTQIDNSRLYAGSPMHYYCRDCGWESDVLPESHTSKPKKLCRECIALQRSGFLGHHGKTTRGLPCSETFREMLYAVHNVGKNAESTAGSDAALAVTSGIYGWLETAIALEQDETKRQEMVDGVVAAVRLLAETTCAKAPEDYAISETKRGLAGDRHEDYGATLELPSQEHETPRRTSGQ